MSRDMCPHGIEISPFHFCADCATAEQLREHLARVLATNESSDKALFGTIEMQRAELATLRTIVTEKFARDIEVAVKPEDAADVARWARNPGAVRELLKHDPVREEFDQEACAGCSAVADSGYQTESHFRTCPVTAAWRALGDPRGQADIERAHEEALREATLRARNPEVTAAIRDAEIERLSRLTYHEPLERLRAFGEAQVVTEALLRLGGVAEGAAEMAERFRLASESAQATRARDAIASRLARDAHHATRALSDARGLEAIEAEAHVMNGVRGVGLTDGYLLQAVVD